MMTEANDMGCNDVSGVESVVLCPGGVVNDVTVDNERVKSGGDSGSVAASIKFLTWNSGRRVCCNL